MKAILKKEFEKNKCQYIFDDFKPKVKNIIHFLAKLLRVHIVKQNKFSQKCKNIYLDYAEKNNK